MGNTLGKLGVAKASGLSQNAIDYHEIQEIGSASPGFYFILL